MNCLLRHKNLYFKIKETLIVKNKYKLQDKNHVVTDVLFWFAIDRALHQRERGLL